MNQRGYGVGAGALLGVALLLSGCQRPDTTTQTGEAPANANAPATTAGGKTYRIAVIPKGTAHSFWQTVKAGAEAAGAEENAQIIFQGPSKETDISEQVNLVLNQVNSNVDGIVLAATDSEGLVTPVKTAMAKGVPVVTIDSGLSQPVSHAYIATDNVDAGRRAADVLAKELGGKGKVGVMPFLKGAASSDEREKGFMEGIKKYPNIQVVSTLYNESDPAKALDQTINMLTAHPDLDGIFAANEPGGVGAANALRQRGLAGKVKLVAFDTSEEELRALNEGVIQALVVQNPYKMGYDGVKTVMKVIRKEPIIEKYQDSGVAVVTKENLNTPEIQKLVNPGKPATG
ncbi:MAG: ABC transporter substrate-binding protein [Armatimonadetes bacterium]|nr:ABC transporter substrate-binding protein [Armatimonadota bacterium]